MELAPIHGQTACALVLVYAAATAALVIEPRESGPRCALVGAAGSGLQPGFTELGEAPQPPACTRVALP